MSNKEIISSEELKLGKTGLLVKIHRYDDGSKSIDSESVSNFIKYLEEGLKSIPENPTPQEQEWFVKNWAMDIISYTKKE